MAKYSDYELEKLLDGYWELCEGMVPLDGNIVREYASPHEAAVCLKADLDLAIDMLSPGKWTGIINSFKQFNKYVFEDNSKLIYKLSRRQQGIVRYHFLKQFDESENAMYSRMIMLRFLNGRIKTFANNQT